MANVIITLKIMPESPDVNLEEVEKQALVKIESFAGKGDTKTEVEPIAFGLKAVKIIFVMDESIGSPEPVEKDIETIGGVQSVETVDVRRAVG